MKPAPISRTRTSPNSNKSRVSNLVDWLDQSSRPVAGNIMKIVTSDGLAKSEILASDPRHRASIKMFDARFADAIRKNSAYAGKVAVTTGLPWSRAITANALDRFYDSLDNVLDGSNKHSEGRKDINLGRLMDGLAAQDIGLKFSTKSGKVSFCVDNASELALFMDHLLEGKNVSKLARSIFGSATTINDLRTRPENKQLTSLLRVLDQMGVRMVVYDRRVEHNPEAPSPSM